MTANRSGTTGVRQRILITGASSGLGEGMAREFARRGRDLVLCARRVERLETLRAELVAAHPGSRIVTRALDVDQHQQVFDVFEAAATEFGGLDRVIVNAGIGDSKRIGTGHFEDNRRTIETNLVSALAQCEAAVGIFRRQNAGHLVTISSVSAVRGLPKHITAYAASKAGLSSLTEGIRADLFRTPIKVTCIHPGFIHTEINAGSTKEMPFVIDAASGARLLAAAIERESGSAWIPWWPWAAIAFLMRHVPLGVIARAT